jgi:hypothetical protein
MFCSKELLATVGCLWLLIEYICGAYIHIITHLHMWVCVCVCEGGEGVHVHCWACTVGYWILQGSLEEYSNKHSAAEKLVLTSLYWVNMCSRWYTPDLPVGTTDICLYQGTKVGIPLQQKSVPSACSQQVTACFRSVFIANCLPHRYFLIDTNRWKLLGATLQPGLATGCSKQLGSYEPTSLQSWFYSQWLPSLWTISEACGWQVICSRCQHKVSCHLQATDTWHQFHLSTLVPHNGYVEVWCAPSATMWHVLTHVNTLRTGSFKLFKHLLPGFLTILTL